ncbi:MAG: imidazoleglycerol-phosphate dehydratase HisB [Planctomycetia bacterium]|nr:imidazoleglycerol-phosphate dehydratase HisB [Planctomycetia bacterium]
MQDELRTSKVTRNTKETQIELGLNLDGTGLAELQVPVGFLEHMLHLFARHGALDLNVRAAGDIHVDFHHLTEDVGIVLGEAFKKALGNKAGIRRYGFFLLPMDETLVEAAVDFSGRPYFEYNVKFPTPKVGDFDTELVRDFFHGFSCAAMCNLHLNLRYGANSHHIAEAIFKCTARAIRAAVEKDPRMSGVPSTKGVL